MTISISTSHVAGIDTVHFRIYHSHSANGRISYHRHQKRGHLINGGERNKIKAPFGFHAIIFKHKPADGYFEVYCSPHAFFHGQNVYSDADLPKACRRIAEQIALHLRFSEKETKAFVSSQIALRRVDIAVNYRFESPGHVREALLQLHRQLAHCSQAGKYCRTFYWKVRGGKDWEIAIYDKGAQLKSKRTSKHVDASWKQLAEHAKGLLRVEVRLRTPALKKLGLLEPKAWVAGKTNRMFNLYAGKLPILKVTRWPISEGLMAELTTAQNRYLWLVTTRAPMAHMYSEASIKKSDRALRDLGISTKALPFGMSDPELVDLFGEHTPVDTAPAWLVKEGRAPVPTPLVGRQGAFRVRFGGTKDGQKMYAHDLATANAWEKGFLI